MTQLVAFDAEKKALKYESVSSYCESDSRISKNIITNKSTYTDKIAKHLVNSQDNVDKRMLKLHNIVENKKEKANLFNFLGIKEGIVRSLTARPA